jgi:hypothetical protein
VELLWINVIPRKPDSMNAAAGWFRIMMFMDPGRARDDDWTP